MKHCRTWKQAGALVLAAVIFGSGEWSSGAGLVTGLAAGGSTTPIAQYSEEERNLFADNVLEYWEIPGLIEHYNPAYLNELEKFYSNPSDFVGIEMDGMEALGSMGGSGGLSVDQLKQLAGELRDMAEELEEELEEKLDSGSLKKGDSGYQDYQENIKAFKKYARDAEKAMKGSAAAKRPLRIAKNQLTVDISAKMREYQMQVSQNEIQKKNLEIAEAAYNSAKRQAELGMYSASQLRAAENARNVAQVSADETAAALAQMRSELITPLGWTYNGNPEIRPIPEPDVTKILSYNLEADMQMAVDSNYDINEIRKTSASEYGGAKKKQEEVNSSAKNVKMQFELLYKNVLSAEEMYNGAQTGWAAAEKKKAQADRKHAVGMISRQEFMAAELEYLTAKASREQAALNLTAAMETYDWAVKGLITPSKGM